MGLKRNDLRGRIEALTHLLPIGDMSIPYEVNTTRDGNVDIKTYTKEDVERMPKKELKTTYRDLCLIAEEENNIDYIRKQLAQAA